MLTHIEDFLDHLIFQLNILFRSHMAMWTWEYRQVRSFIYTVVNMCLCDISAINSWVFRCSLQNKCLSCFWVWRSSLSFFNCTIERLLNIYCFAFINRQLLKYKIDNVVGNGILPARTIHTLFLKQMLCNQDSLLGNTPTFLVIER